MAKFTVHLLTADCTWEGVEANNEDDAIKKCQDGVPSYFDWTEPHTFIACKEEVEDAK
jgi:hypothetical protein